MPSPPVLSSSSPVDAVTTFEALVPRYARLIAAAVMRVGGRAALVHREDIEQQVLVDIWRHLEREQNIVHPSSYIYKAAVRETVRHLRRERARAADPLEAEGASENEARGGPFTAAASQEKATQIEASIRELAPDRQRAVRAHLMGFDVREIMTMYGWTYQRARNLIARGIGELRRSLRLKGIHG
jgi:RNA polymerase sigma factor (sigma-70 family)